MYKKFEINRTKIKGSRQSGRKVVPHDSKSDLPLVQGQIADILSNALFLFSWFSNNQSIEVGKYIHYQIIYLLWKVQRI